MCVRVLYEFGRPHRKLKMELQENHCENSVCFLVTSSSYTGLFGRQVHISYHGKGCERGDHQDVVVGGRRGDGGGEAADLRDPLLYAAGRQASLGVVVPALLCRLADLSQALQAEQQQQKKKKTRQEEVSGSAGVWRYVFNDTFLSSMVLASLFSELNSFSLA